MSWLAKSRTVLQQIVEAEDTEGQGLVEYSLILVLVVLGALAGLTAMGNAIITQLWSVISGVLIPAL
jgi:hypothetical protein